jgi:hypothetical protein
MRFTAKIQNGKIEWHDGKGLARYLYDIDGEVYIDIKPSKQRNTAQNNYYWAMLTALGVQCGYHAEEMHEVCKRHFKISTTKELNKDEFSEYLDRIHQWAAEIGFPIKDPRTTRLP